MFVLVSLLENGEPVPLPDPQHLPLVLRVAHRTFRRLLRQRLQASLQNQSKDVFFMYHFIVLASSARYSFHLNLFFKRDLSAHCFPFYCHKLVVNISTICAINVCHYFTILTLSKSTKVTTAQLHLKLLRLTV